MREQTSEVAENAAAYRPSLTAAPKMLDEVAALVERKDRLISRLEQELETERRENARLRERLDRVGDL